MSEEYLNHYEPENCGTESQPQKEQPRYTAPESTEQPEQTQQSADSHKTPEKESFASQPEKPKSDFSGYSHLFRSSAQTDRSYSAFKEEPQSAEEMTPADKVFTNPYTDANRYQNFSQGDYSHPSQSPNGYYHRSYTDTAGKTAYGADQQSASPQSSYGTGSQSTQAHPSYGTSGQNVSSQPSYRTGTQNSSNPYGYHYAAPNNTTQQNPSYNRTKQTPPQRAKKPERARVGIGSIALILVICIIVSGFAGFGGSMLYKAVTAGSNKSVSDTMVIHQVEAVDTTADTSKLVDKGTDQIASEVADSVVEITTEVMQTSSFYGQYIATGAGSGVIISDDGYILTNNHVIEDASSINVTLRSGESYPATVVGADDVVDIALIKIEAEGLTPAVFGDSDKLEVGAKTVVIGNPLGTLGGSVSEGIISALDRSIVIDGQSMHLLQTDAAINPGNSGGGTFNGQGELIGIVVAKSSSSASSGATIDNIGFVIPINNVLSILSDLKDYGYVRGRGTTGMNFVDLTNSMYSMYYYGNQNAGVYVYSIENGSNAQQAGFKVGDRVISVNGTEVSSSSDIESIISSMSAGDKVEFELERSGQTGKITLTLEERKPSAKSTTTSGDSSQDPFGDFGGFGGFGGFGN